MSTPGIIFSMEFFTADKWKSGQNTFLDYMNRPEAFDAEKHLDDEYHDFMDYMKNEEKSDGVFDLENGKLTAEKIENYRKLEVDSHQQNCPRYVGVMSFTNEFLEKNGVLSERGLDTKLLKDLSRSGMSEMIHKSKKLDDNNVYWTAAIHTNTDNVHVHYSILEYEKQDRKYDKLEVEAFDALKSKVANKIIGSEKTIAITNLARETLLPAIKQNMFNSEEQILKLYEKLPQNQTWQYSRKNFEPYRDDVKKVVNNIINSDDCLKKKFENFNQSLDEQTATLQETYGVGERHLYMNYKKNKLDDFYSRAGNSLLSEMQTANFQSKKDNFVSIGYEVIQNGNDSEPQKRKSYFPKAYQKSSQGYYTEKLNTARQLERLINNEKRMFENHVNSLVREFDFEQDSQTRKS